MENKYFVKRKVEEYGTLEDYSKILVENEEELSEFIEKSGVLDDPVIASWLAMLFMFINTPILLVNPSRCCSEQNEDNIYMFKDFEEGKTSIKLNFYY